ncbi:hypothetical protein T11_11427 [Trichinella zimbabwensis]|uniref:Uncharacterized protein n=1 Tax=Trichinella zimbabwensis TaxID=268475 RepID=A0A0V1GSF9_9BILA|nr:hypothetical protein T11_11427 [Trichinella zimbabwensis]
MSSFHSSASCRPRSASCRPRFHFIFSSLSISKLKHIIKVRNLKHPFEASLSQPYRISRHKKSYMPLVFF